MVRNPRNSKKSTACRNVRAVIKQGNMATVLCKECGRPLTKGRSNPQNKSYWKLCVEPLAEFLEGYTRPEVHELLKYKFLSETRYVRNRAGRMEEVKVTKSTRDLTTSEFNEFMEQIRVWASQLGCWLSEPNEPPMEANHAHTT